MTRPETRFGYHDAQPAARPVATACVSAMRWFVGFAVAAVTRVYNPEDLDAAGYRMVPAAVWEGVPPDRSRIRWG